MKVRFPDGQDIRPPGTLVILPNGHTERHDSLLGMLFSWCTTDSIAIAVIRAGLADESTLHKTAVLARATGQGKDYMTEPACAKVLLGFFLLDRSVRRAIAKHMSKQGQMRKGAAMLAMQELRDQLTDLVGERIGQA